ncbi:hypothetical protein KY329_05145 [Candidatus Woesearchaeota archaeon]|nr:hypothetical protein [Candidatus Woesearchaeota archaeon]
MVWYKKAQLADALLWFFIFILAGASVLVFVVNPQSLLRESVNPVVLDAGNIREMVFERLTAYEFPYGDVAYGRNLKLADLGTINSDNLLSMSDKKITCKVTINDGEDIVKIMFCGGHDGEEKYKHAVALPYQYRWASDERPFISDQHKYKVKVVIAVAKEGYNE